MGVFERYKIGCRLRIYQFLDENYASFFLKKPKFIICEIIAHVFLEFHFSCVIPPKKITRQIRNKMQEHFIYRQKHI